MSPIGTPQSGGSRRNAGIGISAAGFPLISIITPVRNDERGIERAISEVRGQGYPNKEHIIIDGGSQDRTVAVLRRRDSEIDYWASAPDAGIYDAMNRGIEASHGEWIYFFGADDAFYGPETLEALFRQGEIPDEIDLLIGNVLYPDGRLLRGRFGKKLYYKNSIHHQGAFYRRRIFDGFRYGICDASGIRRHFQISGDYQLNLQLLRRGVKHRYVNQVIARCGAGISMAGRFAGYREEIVIRHQYLNFFMAVLFDLTTLLRYAWKQVSAKKENEGPSRDAA